MRPVLGIVTLCLLAAGPAAADDPSKDPSKDDLAAFRKYLEENHKGKKWQTGPSALASPELAKAYPGVRFYFVFSAPPLPPGAFLPELVERHRQALEDYRKNFISLTVAIDEKGVRPLGRDAGDYNRGLMQVANEKDAATAAAAILSLYAGAGQGTGPVAVKESEVRVTKVGAGWTCSVTRSNNFAGIVTLSTERGCERVSKTSIAPLPPSAPPRRP